MSIEIVKFDASYEHLYTAITELLHVAYQALTEAGMTATVQQSPETTLKRLKSGDSFLGFVDSKLVATITVVRKSPEIPIEWFLDSNVFHFTQFAVDIKAQGRGYGEDLLKFAESFAEREGAMELALDTSEKAADLIKCYKKRGYRFVQYYKLPGTSYQSVVLSKNLKGR